MILLLDIEGTTTPISFVTDTLFPYARAHVADYLARHQQDASCRDAIALLDEEHANEPAGEAPRAGVRLDHNLAAIVAYVEWLMDRDRKSRGLKTLQGLIWEEGYRSGQLHGEVFPDVKPALERWRSAGRPAFARGQDVELRRGRRIYIYSSGSVLAQRLLFGSTNAGDLTLLIDGYFDTAVGPKQSAESYRAIVARIDATPAQVLFVSDVEGELDAARAAGLTTALCVRSSSLSVEGSHPVIRSFDELSPFVS